MKILQYDKTQFTLTEEDAKSINEFLSRRDRPTHFTFKGKSLMARKMEVLEEGNDNKPAYMEFKWADDHLLAWEKEIFTKFETFKEYLISEGAWTNNPKYQDGAVKDHQLYRELNAKWGALNDLRFRNEKKTGYIEGKKWIAKLKAQASQLVGKMNVEHDIGCEIQHTGICNCKDEGYEQKDTKECTTCGTLKESAPTPDGDEICPSCGDLEMMDKEPEPTELDKMFSNEDGDTPKEALDKISVKDIPF